MHLPFYDSFLHGHIITSKKLIYSYILCQYPKYILREDLSNHSIFFEPFWLKLSPQIRESCKHALLLCWVAVPVATTTIFNLYLPLPAMLSFFGRNTKKESVFPSQCLLREDFQLPSLLVSSSFSASCAFTFTILLRFMCVYNI